MVLKITTLALILIVLLTTLTQKNIYKDFVETYQEDITLPMIAPFAFAVIDKFSLYKRMPKLVQYIHQRKITLRGSKLSNDYTRIFLARIITLLILFIILTLVLVDASDGGYKNLFIGFILIGVFSFYVVKDLDKKVKQRKDSMLIDLPEFVNKVILLVNAGETIQGAFEKCVQQNHLNKKDSPLYFELNEVVNKMSANTSFQDALKDLNYRSGVQEVSVFTTTVLMNYRKGGNQLTESLKELSISLWEKRKTVTRIKGEEASSKLIFPIIFIFASILLIVIYPAITIF